MKPILIPCALGLLPMAITSNLQAASFEVLPATGDFVGMGQVGAISADGSTIAAAGWSLGTWSPQAVKWTPTGGTTQLDSSLPLTGAAWASSSDGSVLAGWRFSAPGRAACWIDGSNRTLPGLRGSAINGLSGDGSTAVGRNPASESTSYYGVAAKWTLSGGTVTSLGDFPGGATQSEATCISADGSTIAGWGTDSTGVAAFRSVNGAPMANLGDLTGGENFSEALGVSSDGSVIVGRSDSANGMEAFRWTSSGIVGLGDLPGGAFQSVATGISGDGKIVVGLGTSAADNEAFVWEENRGMRSLSAICSAAGLPVSGYRFTYCRPVISEDGDSIAGDAIAPDQTQVLWRLTGLRSLLGEVPKPKVELTLQGDGIRLSFLAEAGFTYQVQQCSELGIEKWTGVGNPVAGDGVEHVIETPFHSTTCFYRLLVSNAP